MKVGLLTYNIGQNYGGVLQAYALMSSLDKLGCKPELLYLETKGDKNWKGLIKKYVLSKFTNKYNSYIYEEEIFTNLSYFIEKYITPKTKAIKSHQDFLDVTLNNYDAYVVGSDQVWRPSLYKYIDYSFFGFVKSNKPIFLSYAPSFGVSNWEYSDSQTLKYKEQIKRFSGVSVREESGIKLCKDNFDIEALHVLDPTALLSKSDYISLIEAENEPKIVDDLLLYILDDSEEKSTLVKLVSEEFNYAYYRIGPKKKNSHIVGELIYPTITSWLNGFASAKFVITDSFHGCVFSIIFNKPFIVYGNKRRGMARFESFLKKFGLSNRLIGSIDDISSDLIKSEIDWEKVNNKLNSEKNLSINFLKKHLKI